LAIKAFSQSVSAIHHRSDREKKIAGFRSCFGHFSCLDKFLDFTLQLVFSPFSFVLVPLVLPRSTEDIHTGPKTEPSEMGTIILLKRSDGSTGHQAQLLIKRAGNPELVAEIAVTHHFTDPDLINHIDFRNFESRDHAPSVFPSACPTGCTFIFPSSAASTCWLRL
jgi:hypothetical protein